MELGVYACQVIECSGTGAWGFEEWFWGMRAKQVKRMTMEEIAGVTGLSLETVRRHKREGVFDMDDMFDTMKYVLGNWLLKGRGKDEAKT